MNRVIFSDNGTLVDITNECARYSSSTAGLAIVAAQDYLFIGSKLPFNHAYFKMGVANTNPSDISVHYWDSDEWIAAVEVNDETNGFTQSGFISFVPNKEKKWAMESTNYNGESVTGLSSVTIYDRYWMRLTFSANLSGTTTLQWIGNLFSDDADLAAEFPDLTRSNVLTSFQTGKTSWEEQHVKAAELVVQDLVNMNIIESGAEILNRADYTNAAVQKCASIIFNSFGGDYIQARNDAQAEYKLRLNKRTHNIDKNSDALEQVGERFNKTGFMGR